MSFLRAFVYDVTITGADEAALTKRAATSAPPKPGSVYYHNEAEELKAVSPDLKAQDGATTADLILSLIATGVGLPKTWLNGIMDVNRASAASMDEPSLKRLRARQQVVIGAVERMVRFALDQASMAGALAKADEAGHPFSVDAPEMSQRDAERASRALFSTIQALGMADIGTITAMKPDAGNVFYSMKTLSGWVKLEPGDWIIQGPPTAKHSRDWYPCKPDIFAATYDQVA